MASAAVNAASRQLNPMALPPMPRIRPPRLLKGDPHPNNNPQPAGDPPKNPAYWLQGGWRLKDSNAYKHHKKILTRQAVRALRQRTHGLDIYAYRHVQTNQVVYSLTRALEVSCNPHTCTSRAHYGADESPTAKSCLEAVDLPWEEDCPGRSQERYVDAILFDAFPSSSCGCLCWPPGLPEVEGLVDTKTALSPHLADYCNGGRR